MERNIRMIMHNRPEGEPQQPGNDQDITGEIPVTPHESQQYPTTENAMLAPPEPGTSSPPPMGPQPSEVQAQAATDAEAAHQFHVAQAMELNMSSAPGPEEKKNYLPAGDVDNGGLFGRQDDDKHKPVYEDRSQKIIRIGVPVAIGISFLTAISLGVSIAREGGGDDSAESFLDLSSDPSILAGQQPDTEQPEATVLIGEDVRPQAGERTIVAQFEASTGEGANTIMYLRSPSNIAEAWVVPITVPSPKFSVMCRAYLGNFEPSTPTESVSERLEILMQNIDTELPVDDSSDANTFALHSVVSADGSERLPLDTLSNDDWLTIFQALANPQNVPAYNGEHPFQWIVDGHDPSQAYPMPSCDIRMSA